ncbi:hypothetical protein G4B88_018426 [Cannabis sativa]|uniref:T-complex protein 11 n=1 Tax=Cannabis sativa TaxID=3483 RepID=A0A7J6G1P9_CANSA|nr:hypothetical protein G4B88_018426 [Cannabis sativa]
MSEKTRGIAMTFPAEDGEKEKGSPVSPNSLSPNLPPRLRRRLMVSKSPITAEHIESKLNQANQRRQQFYELSARRFLHPRKTTLALAKAFEALAISEESVKSMSFEQLALKIESATTIRSTKALLDRLESRYLISRAATGSSLPSLENIDYLLQRVASPVSKENININEESKNIHSSDETPLSSVALPRYPVRVFLCAYMILGHPETVFSGRRESVNDLAQSATDLICEFELLLKIILQGSNKTPHKDTAPKSSTITFTSQLEAFDKAWRLYLLHFVAWKDTDAKLLEHDLVRAACQLELSMQSCKLTPELDMKTIQNKITENQKILREKLQQLSGNQGLENLEAALSEVRSRYAGSKESDRLSSFHPASLGDSSVSVSAETSNLTDTHKSSSPMNHIVFDKDESDLANEVSSSLSFKSGTDGHLSPTTLVVGENELLVNEILHDQHLGVVDSLTDGNEGQNSLKANVRETIEKAFWDGVMESMKGNESDFSWILKLVTEVRDELCHMSPKSWKHEINESIDVDILEQMLRSGDLDVDYFGKVLEFALGTLRKLSAPAKEDDMKTIHYQFLKELGDILQAEDKSKASCALAITKGLRFVLQQIQTLKREISRARLRMVEPLIKGNAGIEYLRKAFIDRHGSPALASTSLPITRQWVSSVKVMVEQEWHEYNNSLSVVTNKEPSSGLPPTTLRTGGKISGTKISSQTSSIDLIDSAFPGEQLPECVGEEIDLLIRLGLLKLVCEVGGLSLEVLPETLKMNLSRLRGVQSQFQKIIVMSTCCLVLRQTLSNENLVTNALDMDTIALRCVNQLSSLLETVEDIGIPDIVETLSGCAEYSEHHSCPEKLEARKQIMARMLGKSLQADDAIFKRVSRAVYLAARGVVFGGNGKKGRELTEASLRPVGATLLADNLVKAAEVLIVVAAVTCNVHRPWYEELLKTL